MNMKKYLLVGAALAVLLPGVAFAQTTGLTSNQVSAIIGLLQAFGADQSIINNVEIDLGYSAGTNTTIGGTNTSAQNNQTQILSQLNEWQQQEQTDQSHLTAWQNQLASSEAQWTSQCANLENNSQSVNQVNNGSGMNQGALGGATTDYVSGATAGEASQLALQQAQNTLQQANANIALNTQALQCSGIAQGMTTDGQYISSIQNKITQDQNEIDYLEALESK
jgi:hypothetical protein